MYGKIENTHTDERRTLIPVFNHDLGDFLPNQVKILRVHQDCALGNHYHDYPELLYMVEGTGRTYLKHVDTGAQGEYLLVDGFRLFVPSRVAHKVNIVRDSILLDCTQEPFTSDANIHKYNF